MAQLSESDDGGDGCPAKWLHCLVQVMADDLGTLVVCRRCGTLFKPTKEKPWLNR